MRKVKRNMSHDQQTQAIEQSSSGDEDQEMLFQQKMRAMVNHHRMQMAVDGYGLEDEVGHPYDDDDEYEDVDDDEEDEDEDDEELDEEAAARMMMMMDEREKLYL